MLGTCFQIQMRALRVPGYAKSVPGYGMYSNRGGARGLQLSTLVVLQSTQSGGTFSTLVLRHSGVLVLGYSYSLVLSSSQLKPYLPRPRTEGAPRASTGA